MHVLVRATSPWDLYSTEKIEVTAALCCDWPPSFPCHTIISLLDCCTAIGYFTPKCVWMANSQISLKSREYYNVTTLKNEMFLLTRWLIHFDCLPNRFIKSLYFCLEDSKELELSLHKSQGQYLSQRPDYVKQARGKKKKINTNTSSSSLQTKKRTMRRWWNNLPGFHSGWIRTHSTG